LTPQKKELGFRVDGPPGTTGYVKVGIPKSLISDISGVKVYLDGKQLDYTSESREYSWLISFTYSHSSHQVIVNLNSTSTSFVESQPGQLLIVGVAITTVAVVAVSLAVRKIRNNKVRSNAE
jgi:hypothetical protein